jgi:hypothetical protein
MKPLLLLAAFVVLLRGWIERLRLAQTEAAQGSVTDVAAFLEACVERLRTAQRDDSQAVSADGVGVKPAGDRRRKVPVSR